MAGEATRRGVDIAARIGARQARRLQMVYDRFAPPSEANEARRGQLVDLMKQFDDAGHRPGVGDDGCAACIAMRPAVQRVLGQLVQGQQG